MVETLSSTHAISELSAGVFGSIRTMVQNPPQDYVGFLTRMIPCLVRSFLGVHVCFGNFTDAGKELLTGFVGLRQYRSR